MSAVSKIKDMLRLERGVKQSLPDGTVLWRLPQSKKLHRDKGPAVEHPNGLCEYYTNGKKNRLDGPAVENRHGGNLQFWIDGKQYSNQFDFEQALKLLQKEDRNGKKGPAKK